MVRGRVLVPGEGTGPLLRLGAPLSLWGGVDPRTGRVTDPRHPQHGVDLAGAVVVLPAAVGSSSSSAVMLELLRNGVAPAAVLMGEADAILALGVVVARELGYAPVPVLEVGGDALAGAPAGLPVTVDADGSIRW